MENTTAEAIAKLPKNHRLPFVELTILLEKLPQPKINSDKRLIAYVDDVDKETGENSKVIVFL